MFPNIDAERARHGMSIEEMVEKLGICRKTYYNWNIRGNIPCKYLHQLANMFDCSVDYLLQPSKTAN